MMGITGSNRRSAKYARSNCLTLGVQPTLYNEKPTMPATFLVRVQRTTTIGENARQAQIGTRWAEQEHLAANLHRLGIVLNFKDDPRLSETHVLNRSSRCSKGVLRLADLEGILGTKDYPSSKRAFLLDLMKKFELCFEFTDDPQQRYLVPELLDKQEPNLREDFHPENCLNFQYHYNIVPEGLLRRFIVRTHVLSARQPRWHSGVVLEFERNRALVKSDTGDRKVTISVQCRSNRSAGHTPRRCRLCPRPSLLSRRSSICSAAASTSPDPP
jgi:hypothetical protein